jgi:hypothetical protein
MKLEKDWITHFAFNEFLSYWVSNVSIKTKNICFRMHANSNCIFKKKFF